MSLNANAGIQRLLGSVMEHYGEGNVVQLVTITHTNGDRDMGNPGTIEEAFTTLSPEPLLQAVPAALVRANGSAFRYSDEQMTVQKAALDADVANDEKTEFNINGDRHQVVGMTPCPNSWTFVVRRKLPNG